jgi:NitT/TauT family transport system substrate-binding protein
MQAFARAVSFVTGPALLAIFALAGCAQSSSPVASKVPIRLGTYEWPGSYWIDVAWQKGWFAEAGLNVQRVDTDGHYFESLDAVVAGRLDGMGFSQFDLVRHAAAGHDLVGVAAIDYSEGAEALIARPGIRSLMDLRGKRVALHRGTYLEYLLSLVAERDGVDLNDMVLVDGSGDTAVADLVAGRVDAVFVWEPYATEVQTAVNGNRIFSTAEIPSLTYSVFSLRKDFVDAHPGEVQALLTVWQRSVEFIREHPREACDIVARAFNDEPVESVRDMMRTDRILDAADNGRAFSYAAGFESLHGSWRRMNDFMIERGLVSRRVESPRYLDSRFIRALE